MSFPDDEKLPELIPLDVSKLPAPAGLTNCNAVCYMNAVLQAVGSLTGFRNFILTGKSDDNVNKALRGYFEKGDQNLGNKIAPEFAKHSNLSTLSSIVAMCRNDKAFREKMGDSIKAIEADIESDKDYRTIAKDMFSLPDFNKIVDPIVKLASKHSTSKVEWEGNGWQDSQEALIHLLEATGADKARIFRLSYDTLFKCTQCGLLKMTETSKSARPQDSVYLYGGVYDELFSNESRRRFDKGVDEETLRTSVLSRYVWYTSSDIENSQEKYGYTCPTCNMKPKKLQKVRKLSQINSVICIFMPQFRNRKKAIPLTPFIKIQAPTPKDQPPKWHHYRFVSQVEYTGGHYFAHALRNDGKVYCLNDNSVRPSKLESTLQTVLAFYHYDGTR